MERAPKFGSILPVVYPRPYGASLNASAPSPKKLKTEEVASPSGSLSAPAGVAPLPPMPDAGSWVKFRGLHPQVYEGQLQCSFGAYSTWTIRVEDSDIIRCAHTRALRSPRCRTPCTTASRRRH